MSTFQELTLGDCVSKRKEITSKQRNRSVLMFWSTFNAYFNHYNNIIDELSFLKDTVPVENHSFAIEHYNTIWNNIRCTYLSISQNLLNTTRVRWLYYSNNPFIYYFMLSIFDLYCSDETTLYCFIAVCVSKKRNFLTGTILDIKWHINCFILISKVLNKLYPFLET